VRRRPFIVLAVLVLLAAGIVAGALVFQHERQAKDVRGSSTAEFHFTPTPQKPPPPTAKVQWPMYGFGPTRTRRSTSRP
jgi:hypothetical protein